MDKDRDIDAGAPHSPYPAMGRMTEREIEEELDRGKVYRLNDRFFKFLFGREDRKPLGYRESVCYE